MGLEHMLGQIQPNYADFAHDALPPTVVQEPTLADQGRRGRLQHQSLLRLNFLSGAANLLRTYGARQVTIPEGEVSRAVADEIAAGNLVKDDLDLGQIAIFAPLLWNAERRITRRLRTRRRAALPSPCIEPERALG